MAAPAPRDSGTLDGDPCLILRHPGARGLDAFTSGREGPGWSTAPTGVWCPPRPAPWRPTWRARCMAGAAVSAADRSSTTQPGVSGGVPTLSVTVLNYNYGSYL